MKAFLAIVIPLFAIAACATSKEGSQPAPAATAPSPQPTAAQGSTAATAPQVQEKPPVAPAQSGSGATTASEAAQKVHEEWVRTHGTRPDGSGGDMASDAAPCSSDDQCALTRIAEGGCCETLCVPRAVTRVRADALAANQQACTHGKACPDISCHPTGQQSVQVKCEAGRCLARQTPGSAN